MWLPPHTPHAVTPESGNATPLCLAYKNKPTAEHYRVSSLFLLSPPPPSYARASCSRIFMAFLYPSPPSHTRMSQRCIFITFQHSISLASLRPLGQKMSQNPSSNIFTTSTSRLCLHFCAATASVTVNIRNAIAAYSITTATNLSTGFCTSVKTAFTSTTASTSKAQFSASSSPFD
jgi:hypothetical protein